MRLFVLFLVAFNLAIFAWFTFKNYKDENKQSSKVRYDLLNVPSLVLKSELDAPLLESMREEKRVVGRESEQSLGDVMGLSLVKSLPGSLEDACLLVGPYDEVVTARMHVIVMGKAGIATEMVENVTEQSALYWVFIPPFLTEKGAVSALKKLQENSKDSYVVTEGEFKNAISLGVFRVASSAEMVRQEVIRLGFNAKMKLRKKEIKAIWLSIERGYEAGLTHDLFEVMKTENILLKKEEKPCEDVALLKRIL